MCVSSRVTQNKPRVRRRPKHMQNTEQFTIISVNQTYTMTASSPPKRQSAMERLGDTVDTTVSGFFYKVGRFCCSRPKLTIALALGISIACAGGMSQLTPENRSDKLWIPQGTVAEGEADVSFSCCCCSVYCIG